MTGTSRVRFELLRGGPTGPRYGRVWIGSLAVDTPAFMPVGTRAAVKGLDGCDLEALGASILLANTYHLYLRPGSDRIQRLGGLHRFMSWDRGILTDSGGFQVYSLAGLRRIHADGVEFQSHLDGSRHKLSPERVLEIQADLGSDIRMVLDVCTPFPAERETVERDLDRTLDWAGRSRRAWAASESAETNRAALFGIVQGGIHGDLRSRAARELVSMDFDGYALGGLSVGEPVELRPEPIEAAVAELPAEKPRYLMGVGTPLDILDAVGRGIDLFDCVLPTRNARKGSVFSWHGRMAIKSRRYAEDPRPIDPECECSTCRRYSRAYVRHLFQVGELLAGRLATIHSVAFYQQFMARMREAIWRDRFADFAGAARERMS